MHPYVLVPLLAFVAGIVFASASVARAPGARVSWCVSGLLASSSAWALLAVLANASQDGTSALHLFRAMGVPILAIGPVCLLTLAEIRPELAARLRGPTRAAAMLALCTAVAFLSTSAFVLEVTPVAAPGGVGAQAWAYRFGPWMPLMVVQSAGVPAWCLLQLRKPFAGTAPKRRLRLPGGANVNATLLAGCIALSSLVVLVTDVLLPALAIDFPPLGSSAMAFIGGSAWLASYRLDRRAVTSSALAREILDDLPDGVAVIERDGRIRALNESFAALLGERRGAMIGRRATEILPLSIDQLGSEFVDREAALRRATGETIPVAVSTSIVRDRQQDQVGLVLVIRDEREVVGLRRQIVTSGRLAAIGELAAVIAHEVNNPIAFVQANLNLLRDHYDEIARWLARHAESDADDPAVVLGDGPERVEACLEDVGRVAEIVREVRGFAHAGEARPQLCDVRVLIDSALKLATLRLDGRARVQQSHGELPSIHCAAQDLKQVFLSLIRRAAAALAPGGCICVTSRQVGDQVEICVKDDGAPIPAERLDRVFDPPSGRDASWLSDELELSICYQIVQHHGGTISLESGDGSGTRVQILLPVAGFERRAPA